MTPIPVDLEHEGLEGAICTYLVPDSEPLLVDPGPATTLDRLRDVLDRHGVGAGGLSAVLLTHVHLDHAGGVGHLVRENPRLVVHVHEDAAPHLVDPTRLVASTRRTFGDAHDRLWGPVLPVSADRIRAWSPAVRLPFRGLRALHTPGHIAHHLAYLDERDGLLFAGDAMGIVLGPEAPTHPPTPPPSLELERWLSTLEALEVVGPERFAVSHFGIHGGFRERREALADALRAVARRVEEALERGDLEDAERYEEEVRSAQARGLPRERVDQYFDVFAARTDWEGIRFWLERRSEGAS